MRIFSQSLILTPPLLSAFWVRRSANRANRFSDKYHLLSSKQSVKGAMNMNEITYSRNGDYLIPDLTLTQQPTQPLGKYGRMRKTYLEEHRKALFNHLLLSEKLQAHLLEIDQTANRRLEQIMADLQKTQTPPGSVAKF
ncbi:TnpV protein [Lactococcus lactis]|nr:TnpV protein [Lactococcus lactis]